MEILKRLLPLLTALTLPAFAADHPYSVIAYHDVRDRVAGDYDPDQFALSTANLIDQFTWLRDHGFHVVSMDQVVAARDGLRPLPDKAVVLSFDDGLVSVYTHLFPLLKLFDYPAVVNVVTSWIESDAVVDYAEKKRASDGFLSWEQMREMQASGLVEIATHSHDMHRGIRSNPQGNLRPVAKSLAHDGDAYESESDFRRRIRADLALSVAAIENELGRRPRVVAWPYGAYNSISESVAAELGLHVSLTLDRRSGSRGRILRLGRYLVTANPALEDFSNELLREKPHPLVRAAQVDLDFIFDPDPKQQQRNLDRLLDRVKSLQISHVFVKAFSDDAGDGASAVYFPNRHLPMRTDLYGYVAWQLKTRAGVQVFAWLPMLSFYGGPFDPDWRVPGDSDGPVDAGADSVSRLSPFNPAVRETIAEVYEDLASRAHLDGVLFHEDGRSSDAEDFSGAARSRYRDEFGRDMQLQDLIGDDDVRRRWAAIKRDALVDFSSELLDRVRRFHPTAKSARRIFPSALLDPRAPDYLARDFDVFLDAYDLVALQALAGPDGAGDQNGLLEKLAAEVGRREEGLDRTLFELQTGDPERSRNAGYGGLHSTMRWLQSIGVRNLSYFSDAFLDESPALEELRLGMSLADDLVGAHH